MFIVVEMYLREMTPLSTPAQQVGGVASDLGSGSAVVGPGPRRGERA